MARYIDIEKEITDMQSVLAQRSEDKDTVAYFAFEKIIERLKKAPTADVVEVVRCKDCVHSCFIRSCSKYECQKGFGALKFLNDFCSYGERK